MLSSFTYNGVSSASMGVFVEKAPNWPKPRRKRDVYSIPGRNGDIVFDQGAFETVTLEYPIAYIGGAATASEIADWLLSAPDYCRLEDTYYPDVYRLVRIDGPLDIENTLGKAGRAKLRMYARPEVFTKAGDSPIDIPEDGWIHSVTIHNPFPFNAKPIIEIEGYGTVNLSTPGGGLEVRLAPYEPAVTIDCERQTLIHNGFAYESATTVYGEFPHLLPGENVITISAPDGEIRGARITPRWWHL